MKLYPTSKLVKKDTKNQRVNASFVLVDGSHLQSNDKILSEIPYT